MYVHKSGAQKRKEKRKRDDNERKGLQTLFQFGIKKSQDDFKTCTNANLVEMESDKRESDTSNQDSRCRSESQANEEANLEECANPTNTVVNSECEPGTSGVYVHSKSWADSEQEVSEASKSPVEVVVVDKLDRNNTDEAVRLDIGFLTSEIPFQSDIEKYVIKGHTHFPLTLPNDSSNRAFPKSVLTSRNINGEKNRRDWLVWSQHTESLYCFPCRLFWSSVGHSSSKSALATVGGWPASALWRKLCNRVPEHERSNGHRQCYLAWRELERRLSLQKGIETLLERSIQAESEKWYNILKRIIDVILFLGERGLAFRGSSQRVGDSDNGNFLGLIELLSHWDPILKEHVLKVEESQKNGDRLQVHYLSPASQNEFIKECSDLVEQRIMEERQLAKYYAIIVDSTPDSSHVEQTTFLLRYLVRHKSHFEIVERFLKFVDCSGKTGSNIAEMITETLESHAIPLSECRAQGYDNAANMSGKYKGAQAIIKEQNPLVIFSPCGCHTLNLCGNDAAACIPEASTYFGTIQTIYTLFSCSPKRWEILTTRIGVSLHGISGTRWSDRVESVKPFVAHLPGVRLALEGLLELNITSKTRNEIHGALCYVKSFTCIIMSIVWHRILLPIDICNKIIQGNGATVDMEVANLESLLQELLTLRDSWEAVWNEAKLVASSLQITVKMFRERNTSARKRTRFQNESTNEESVHQINETDESIEEAYFRKDIFYVVLDNVIGELTIRFNAAKQILDTFGFLWNYQNMTKDELTCKAVKLAERYCKDISKEDLVQEINHISMVHNANFDKKQLNALDLLNALVEHKLETIFPNLIISLRMFLTAPATIASAERSFSKLKLIKNHLRSTMGQDRLTHLARLSIESNIAKQINFDCVIRSFAKKKARKAALFSYSK